MKTKLFYTVMLMMGLSTLSSAQYGHLNNDRHHTTYRYNNTNAGYYDNYRGGPYNLDRMTRSDRKALRRMEDRLYDLERLALRDGYVSRREARRINEVKDDIAFLLDRYRVRTRVQTRRSAPRCR